MDMTRKSPGRRRGAARTARPKARALEFNAVARGTLSSEVVKEIQHLVATEHLKPGDRLPSGSELSKKLGVSQTVIRDALQRLAALGILDIQRGSGTFVREKQYLTLPAAQELFFHDAPHEQAVAMLEARCCLEVYLAGLAAERASDQEIEALRVYMTSMESGPNAGKKHFAPDIEFEKILAKAAHNPLLEQLLAQVHVSWLGVLEQTGYIPREFAERQAQHRAIVEALERRDPAAARHAMEMHLNKVPGVTG